jgi:Spy/CpxP family protein refolding chaperone
VRKYFVTSAFALSLALTVPSAAVFAQDAQTEQAAPPDAADRQGKMLDMMAEKLNLSDQQKEQLKPIFAERREKMQALRASGDRPMKKKREAKSIMEDSDAKVKGVLTADQWTQYQQLKAQMREQMKERRQQQSQ